jgi:hypothetical protein
MMMGIDLKLLLISTCKMTVMKLMKMKFKLKVTQTD